MTGVAPLTRIYYRRGSLFIDGVPTAVPAESLSASSTGDVITVISTHSPDPVVSEPYYYLSGENGVAFATVDDALNYLNAQFVEDVENASVQWVVVRVPITQRGQTELPLPRTPTQYSSLSCHVNNLTYDVPHVTLNPTSVTWNNLEFVLDPSDDVVIRYL